MPRLADFTVPGLISSGPRRRLVKGLDLSFSSSSIFSPGNPPSRLSIEVSEIVASSFSSRIAGNWFDWAEPSTVLRMALRGHAIVAQRSLERKIRVSPMRGTLGLAINQDQS